MDTEATKIYYQRISDKDICDCSYCKNYIHDIRETYPELTSFLHTLGVDIEKPFELMPLEEDAEGYVDYIGEQYIVMGSTIGFEETSIDGARIRIADSHPATSNDDEHFVIEVSPVRLKWVQN